MNGKTKSSTDSDPGQTTVERLMIGQSAGMMHTAIALLCRDIDRLSGFKDEGP